MSLFVCSVNARSTIFASFALPVFAKIKVSVFFGKFMALFAMRFTKIRTHCQTFVKNSSFWVKQFFKSFAFCRSCNDCVGLKATKFSQQSSFVLNAFNRDVNRITPVHHLLFSGRPSTIARLVITIIVDAFNGISSRRFSHILQESNKAIFPTITNGNSSTAVISVSGIFGVKTSLFHGNPCAV